MLLTLGIILFGQGHKSESVDISVVDVPKTPPKVLSISRPEPKPVEKKVPRAVFGVSRKAITSDTADSVDAKAGNTLAKAPDQEKLNPDDPDALPVPTEEYLVSRMPELAQEVRIPYPPDAKKRGIEGPVVMDLLIDANGKVRESKLVSGPDASLNSAALEAVKGFVFKPALIQDKAVAVRIRYAYRFVLER
jgi:protein TonB